MLNITNYQRNANQNYNAISPHTSQNDHHQKPDERYSPWNSPGQNTGVGSLSLLRGIFTIQGSIPRSPIWWADSLPAEPQGKPKNTGLGSLSLLQTTFLTQELNWGLLHCRWILYQMSYQGSSGPGKLVNFMAIQWPATAFSLGFSWGRASLPRLLFFEYPPLVLSYHINFSHILQLIFITV